MGEFKGTKGKWIFDPKSESIKNENVTGLLATAWNVYNIDEIEIREPGESWLDMRERTKVIKEQKKIETRANALLISKAPEMLEMLKELREIFDKYSVSPESQFFKYKKTLEQLIKESTELN